MSALRHGLVGYGAGGRFFHAPFIDAAAGIELAGIVARDPERVATAKRDHPGVPVFDSLSALIAAGVESVTVTTPPQTHAPLALEAMSGGLHVVVDKPFAPDAVIARALAARAVECGVVLSVYQNRRWDADIRTLASVLQHGLVGEPWRITSRMFQDDQATIRAGVGNGLLLDLGSHLLDQMICLLGPVAAVTAHLAHVERGGESVDAACAVDLLHANGATSYVEASKSHRLAQRQLMALGTLGSYTAASSDVQWLAIESGCRPAEDPEGWGYESEDMLGTLWTHEGGRAVPSAQGRWHDFYTGFAHAVRTHSEPPVTMDEAIHLMDVLDAARASAQQGQTVSLRRVPQSEGAQE